MARHSTHPTSTTAASEQQEDQGDIRLKTDIAALGKDASGNKIYSWKYKNDPVTTWVGAQMMTLEQWNSRSL